MEARGGKLLLMTRFPQRVALAVYQVEDIRALHMAHVDHTAGFPADVEDELTLTRHMKVVEQCNEVLAVLTDLQRGLNTL